MTARRVVLMRHAKSSWKEDLPDHDRPLSRRGLRDGLAAAELFVRLGLAPEQVLCSTSARTRATWQRLVDGGADVHNVRFLPEIYHADGNALVRMVQQIPNDVTTAAVIGHWPAVQEAVLGLAPIEANEHWHSLLTKFPTSALAIIEVPGSWAQAGNQTGTLRSFHIPRDTR